MPGLAALKQLRGATRVLPNSQSHFVDTIPPPIGGWNRRDTIPLMDPRDAIILDNIIPDTTSVHLRSGFAVHATIAATATAIESLIPYTPPNSANRQLFAAIPSAIYDVTAEQTASSTAAVVTGTTNGRWQHDQLTNATGSYLFICNGADAARLYDGSTWTTASVTATGLTIESIVNVHNHMNRFWFVQENALDVWYMSTSAISGAPTQFILPFRKGGKLMAMGSWSRDGGAGLDDLAVFVSSRGECVIYSGTDPDSASTWGLVGIYNIPDVIGRRCLINAGADLAVLTSQGLFALSQVIARSEGAAIQSSITDKISGYFREQYAAVGTLFGWEVEEYPGENLLVVNVPKVERSEQEQAIMNIHTGAWCRFTGINAGCWRRFGDDIYFGGNNGVVYKYGGEPTDDGENIIATLQSAYSTFGSPKTKRFSMARPLFISPGGYDPPVTVQVDYDTSIPTVTVSEASTAGTEWDVGLWDTFLWAGGAEPSVRWQGIFGEGRAASIAFGISSSEELIYNGCDVGYEQGNFL